MLKDEVRTSSYRNSIMKNTHLFKGTLRAVTPLVAAPTPFAHDAAPWPHTRFAGTLAVDGRQGGAGRWLRHRHPVPLRGQGGRQGRHRGAGAGDLCGPRSGGGG